MATSSARLRAFAAGAAVAHSGVFAGCSLRETAGAVATVRLWDNASAASGTIIATLAFTAGADKQVSINDDGVWFDNGIFVEVVAGTVEGSLYLY